MGITLPRGALLAVLLVVAVLLAVIAVLLPGTILAHPGPPPPTPTPHAQQTALSGRVPAPSGAVVTLKAMDLTVGFKDCGTDTSLAGPNDSPETSSFQFVLDGACLAGTQGVMVCWSPRSEDCNIVTASVGQLRQSYFKADVPSFTELGQTLDTGLLAPRVKEAVTPPHGDGVRTGGIVPDAGLADADQQVTASSGSGPGPDQQIADLSQTEQGARYAWLLWAGAALLVAGLALATAVRVKARRR